MSEEAGRGETRAIRLSDILGRLSDEIAREWFRMLGQVPDEVGDGDTMAELYSEFGAWLGYEGDDTDLLEEGISLGLQLARMKLLQKVGDEETRRVESRIMGEF